MTRQVISNFIFLFILAGLQSCFMMKDMSNTNMADVYRPSDQLFHPELAAYNITSDTTNVYAKILPGEFLFVRQDDGKFRSSVKLTIQVIASYENPKLIDSSSATYSFELSGNSNYEIISATVPVKDSGKFLIHAFLTDENKGSQSDFFIDLDKQSHPSRNDFLITDKNNEPLFRNYISSTDSINIIYRNKEINSLFCKYYKRDFPLPPPPFSFDSRQEFNYAPDSVFNINISKEKIYLPGEGFYQFREDSAGKDGLTIYRFYTNFPDVTTASQMTESVRYLTNKKEFEEIKNAPNQKSMVDNFWLTHGGNMEKSRGLIKKYYSRVRESNKYFSSFTEGWRTDRGLIYIIFGSPSTIYRSETSESWTYGTANSSLALNFFFVKVNNPFTDNDFILSRSPSYEATWYRAIDVWRQGRAFNSFN